MRRIRLLTFKRMLTNNYMISDCFLPFDLRLFTVPYFFVRSFRYTASYRHEYLDFQMYRGGGRRGL